MGLRDAIIVGGGPAGMSAALLLGRCTRRVLVCDDGRPRNAAARHFHGFLSRDHSSPQQFRQIARAELTRYPEIEWRDMRVTGIHRGRHRFTATLADGAQVDSRTVLLANGVIDELPRIQGFEQFFGATVHLCPYCDGWEHRGERTAVMGGDECAAELAIELRIWSHDVVLCSNGPLTCDALVPRLASLGIPIISKGIHALEGESDRLRAIRFADNESLPIDVLYFSPQQRQRAPFAEQLGCKFDALANTVRRDERGATCIPGVYVAGNSSRGVQLAVVAAAEGTLAAIAINEDLHEADCRNMA